MGKTVAIRVAAAQLDPTSYHVICVSNPAFGTRGCVHREQCLQHLREVQNLAAGLLRQFLRRRPQRG